MRVTKENGSVQVKIIVTLSFKYEFNALLFQVRLWCP